MNATTQRRSGWPSRGTILLLVLMAATAALLAWPARPAAEPGPGSNASADAPAAVASSLSTALRRDAPPRTADVTPRDAAPLAPPPAPLDAWTVQLVGLDPAVPWMAPLRFVFERRFEAHGEVDASGVCRFEPPAAARNPGIQIYVLAAEDPNYRVEHTRHRTDSLQASGRHQVRVHRITTLAGRVLGPDGQGIVARIAAFAHGPDGPREPLLARTDSLPDGSYRLRVPRVASLFVLAEATGPGAFQFVPTNPPSLDLASLAAATPDDLSDPDHRSVRGDLLPAGVPVDGPLDGRTVPDLQLRTPARLTGRVTTADGRPLANATVAAAPAPPTTRWRQDLHWSASAGLLRPGRTGTDARGTFVLLLPAGLPFLVRATASDPLLAAGEPEVTAVAPGSIELLAPGDRVTLRVLADGRPVPRATIEIGERSGPTDAAGELRATLDAGAVRLHARSGAQATATLDLPPGARPALVTLALTAVPLAEARIVLQSRQVLRGARFGWQPLPDGRPLLVPSERERDDAPFVMQVPVGSHRLTVQGQVGAPGGDYMLPLHLDVDVPPAGLVAAYDVAFGGRLLIDALDGNGQRVGGRFTLHDPQGRDVTCAVTSIDGLDATPPAPGVLLSTHINHLAAVLPPGDYTLVVTTPDHGRVRSMVTVRANTTTTATVRLE